MGPDEEVQMPPAFAYAEAVPDATENALTGRVIIVTPDAELTLDLDEAKFIFGTLGQAVEQIERGGPR